MLGPFYSISGTVSIHSRSLNPASYQNGPKYRIPGTSRPKPVTQPNPQSLLKFFCLMALFGFIPGFVRCSGSLVHLRPLISLGTLVKIHLRLGWGSGRQDGRRFSRLPDMRQYLLDDHRLHDEVGIVKTLTNVLNPAIQIYRVNLIMTQFSRWQENMTFLNPHHADFKQCVAPAAGKACCPVLRFAEMTYYSDVGGVKVI
jgi:hypothetical protein